MARLLDSYSQCLSYGRERWIVRQGNVAPFPAWVVGRCLSHGGGGVLRALMFPRQETPSPSCTLYLFACSPIFIRLYLRLESVPLHFLLRSSSSSSRRHRRHHRRRRRHGILPFPLRVPMRWQQHANILVFAIRMPQNGDGKPRRNSPRWSA